MKSQQNSVMKSIRNTVLVLKKTFIPEHDSSYKFSKSYFK